MSRDEAAIRLDTSFTKFFSLEKVSNPTLPDASITNPTSRISLQGAVMVKSFERRQLASVQLEDWLKKSDRESVCQLQGTVKSLHMSLVAHQYRSLTWFL